MKSIEIQLPYYDYSLTIATLYNEADAEPVTELCQREGVPQANIDRLVSELDDSVDFALSFTNTKTKRSLIVLGPWSETCNFHGNLAHESHHVILDIFSTTGLELGDASAYLAGYITQEVSKRINQLA